jgi:polysaccharide biosynthesis protein PslH
MRMLIVFDKIPFPVTGCNQRTFYIAKGLSKNIDVDILALPSERNDLTKKLPNLDNLIIINPFIENIYRNSKKFQFLNYIIKAIFYKCKRLLKMGCPSFTNFNYQSYILREALKRQYLKKKYDLIQVEHFHLAEVIKGLVFKSNCKLILDFHEIESELLKNSERILVENEEKNYSKLYDLGIVCSKTDSLKIKKRWKNNIIVENGVDTEYFKFSQSSSIDKYVFVASMTFQPNIDAANHFINKIQGNIPKKQFQVIGYYTNKPKSIDKNIKYLGYIEDIRPFLKNSIMVCPIFKGSGTRIKILTAFSSGCPVISTSKGAEGIRYTKNKDIIIADSDKEFIEGIKYLIDNKEICQKIALNARKLAESYDWTKITDKYYEDLKQWI